MRTLAGALRAGALFAYPVGMKNEASTDPSGDVIRSIAARAGDGSIDISSVPHDRSITVTVHGADQTVRVYSKAADVSYRTADKLEVGHRIRSIRKTLGMDVREFAAAINIGYMQVSHMECGLKFPSYPTLQSIAKLVWRERKNVWGSSQDALAGMMMLAFGIGGDDVDDTTPYAPVVRKKKKRVYRRRSNTNISLPAKQDT